MREWINIKDRLPKIGQGILITDGKTISIGEFNQFDDNGEIYFTGYGFNGYEWDYDFNDEDVTHWMELPDLPITRQCDGEKGGER